MKPRQSTNIDNLTLDFDNLTFDKGVCGIKINKDDSSYNLKSFENKDTLPENWHITHFGQCGSCSTVQDLKTYINVHDMMSATRSCGKYLLKRRRIKCLKKMGLTSQCAGAWDNNIISTRKHCLWPCLQSWITNKPNNIKGALNECLQCDENVSGPQFVKEAGRTRRNSGIISNIGRNKSETHDIDHSKYVTITEEMKKKIRT